MSVCSGINCAKIWTRQETVSDFTGMKPDSPSSGMGQEFRLTPGAFVTVNKGALSTD